MALTKEDFDDLTTRLEQLVGEYAAASQRSEAIGKLHTVLERVSPEPVAAAAADEPAAEPEPAPPVE